MNEKNMNEKKCCRYCHYSRYEEEWFFDHYRIPEHYTCIYDSRIRPKEVDPHGICPNFKAYDA